MDTNISISACPHDCPSTCALEVTHDKEKIYKVKGAEKTLILQVLYAQK